MHDQDVRAVQHPDLHGLVGPGGQRLRPQQRPGPELVVVQERVAELEERRAQAVLAGLGVLLHQLLSLQGPEQAVDGGLGQPQSVRQLGDHQAGNARPEGLQDLRGTLDGLDQSFLAFQYCRMVFGIIDSEPT